jgi:hypothetical protein
MAKKRKQSYMGQMINTGVGNLVGVGLIGATASAVQGLPAGTARDIAGITPGLQSVAMLGPNLKFAKDSLDMDGRPRRRMVRRRVRKMRY